MKSSRLIQQKFFQTRNFYAFGGHTHYYKFYAEGNDRYYTLATTGGGSQLRGLKFGEYDHITWVTVDLNQKTPPTVVNLKLAGILAD